MKNFRLGLGSLIADDMGLGKTLQVITALDELKREGELKTGESDRRSFLPLFSQTG